MTNKISTDTQIQKAIKQVIKEQKELSFSIVGFKGLVLRIRPNKNSSSTSDFRHRYTRPFTTKRPYMTLGIYPSFSLEQARKAHTKNLELLAKNIDPKTHKENERIKQVQAINNTFDIVANHWLSEQTSNPKDKPAKKTLSNWGNQLKPLLKEFSGRPIESIATNEIVNLCKRIQKTNIEKGTRINGVANRIFSHAVLQGLIEHNPLAQIKGARVLKTKQATSHPALTKPIEFSYLLNDIDTIDNQYNRAILKLLALTFVRVGDICSMKWDDIDFDAKQWTFTPQKGKGRTDMIKDFVVPLAPQVIAILKEFESINAGYTYVFHSHTTATRHHRTQRVNEELNSPKYNTQGIGKGYENKGYKNVHSPHGFRATAKTMLMERLGYDELITEMQLGHRMLNKYGKAYNRMEASEERIKMMADWANYLDDLRAKKFGNVIHANFRANDQQDTKTS